MFSKILIGLSLVAAASAHCSGKGCPSKAHAAAGAQITTAPAPPIRRGGSGGSHGGSGGGYQVGYGGSNCNNGNCGYDQSYYSSFYGGGYSSMDCGYGYGRDNSNNYCTQSSWVRWRPAHQRYHR
jgi:hypothetical protein